MTYPPGQNPYGPPQGASPYGAPQNPYAVPGVPPQPASPYSSPDNSYSASPYGGQYPYGGQPLAPYGAPPAPNGAGGTGLALASMICGIVVWVLCSGGALLSFTGLRIGAAGMVLGVLIILLALAAVICGGIALAQKTPAKAQAIVGVALGSLYLLICAGMAIFGMVAGIALMGMLS